MEKITYLGTQGCPGTIALGINYQITSEECKLFEQYDCDTFAKAFKCFINIEHKCFYIQCADYAVYGILYSVDDKRGGCHTYLFAEGNHTIEEMETIIANNAFLKKQFDVENRFKQNNIGMKFAEIIERLKNGETFTRVSWEGNKYIACQIPQVISKDIVPKMTSLPDDAKRILSTVGSGAISYHDQVLIINNEDKPDVAATATSYVPTWEDIFADDWTYK